MNKVIDHLDEIIGHLGAAVMQQSHVDDVIICDHVEKALSAALRAKHEIRHAEKAAE